MQHVEETSILNSRIHQENVISLKAVALFSNKELNQGPISRKY